MSLALLSFPHIFDPNSEMPISAESYIFIPKNVSLFMLSTIGRESYPVKFAFTMRTMLSKREDAVERM